MSEKISVRVTTEEKEMTEKLANYLFKKGKIQENSISEAVRLSIRYLSQEILRVIEQERLDAAARGM